MCQLVDAELDKYVTNITNSFCGEQKCNRRQKVKYIKKAAVCLGKQPG